MKSFILLCNVATHRKYSRLIVYVYGYLRLNFRDKFRKRIICAVKCWAIVQDCFILLSMVLIEIAYTTRY